MEKKITIAIDGFSSSGKSTMAKKLAKTIGYAYIDTGAMYRAVTLFCLNHNLINGDVVDVAELERSLPDIKITFGVNPATGASETYLNGERMGAEKGIVMDGRDIGTVVFPDAEMKIYVDASAETRARRRFDELRAKGNTSVTFEEVLRNVQERDHIDQTRAESPLRKADDALVLDNSHMTIAEQDAWLLDTFRRITAQ